jgi:hypothetical protein
VSAQLAELVGTNSSFLASADAAAQSWLSFPKLSHQQACMVAELQANDTGCYPPDGASMNNLDCSTNYAAGVSVLADLTKNSSMQQM